ncbi:glycosyltransferase [Geodermatophilus sp. CPCC 206100]|uniref:glycosyltransferase n=1 Tax=Geodermatophilus sp. CPCC 206100 TaxID=3020054 RepID=UPI003B0048C0
MTDLDARGAAPSRSGPAPAPPAPGTDAVPGPPRILLAVTDPFCAVFFRGQLAALAAAGAEVTLVTSPGERARAIAAEEGARYCPVPMVREMAPLADLRALLTLVRLLRRLRPDVVCAGTPKAALLVLAAAAAVRVPDRLFVLHGLRSTTLSGLKRAVVRAAERTSARLATDVLCVSSSLRDEAAAEGLVQADRARVVGSGSCNGVDLERFRTGPLQVAAARRFRRGLGCGPEETLIGFVGRLTKEKGLLELAEAWQLVRDGRTRLVLIGPDESGPDCEPALRLLRRDPRVRFTGAIDDMPAAFAAMDLLVLPTWREGFGNVLIEAAAMSRPVIASRVTGCVDAVADGVTGTLVPPRDAVALADAIQEYLDRPDVRTAHGTAGRRRVEVLFDSRRVWQEHLELYDALLRRRGRPALLPSDDRSLPRPAPRRPVRPPVTA